MSEFLNTRFRKRKYARYYPVARTAHLERLSLMRSADFLYSTHRRDWDENLARSMPDVHQFDFISVVRLVWRNAYERLEIPEPLAIVVLPQTVVLALVVKAKRILRRRLDPTSFVYYAIENLDQVGKIRTRIGLPDRVIRGLLNCALSLVLSETSKAVFGTEGSLRTYKDQLGPRLWRRFSERAEVELIPGLSAPSATNSLPDSDLVCFLGSFEWRKGLDRLMSAWPHVRRMRPESRLVILGHGDHVEDVRAFSELENVLLHEDPPREMIMDILGTAHCLVLPSRRTPVWREQIGLPILEALSAGCEIVTTSETGIAGWLRDNGHRVVDSDSTDKELATAIVEALNSNRTAGEVQASLPDVDGRIEADRWLFAEEQEASDRRHISADRSANPRTSITCND